MMWSDSHSFDAGEMQQVMAATSIEAEKVLQKQRYFKRLRQIQDKPYFASIVFKDDKDNSLYNIYMSLTYLKDKNSNNILYDWRSPICSLFYDYETGPCSYSAPGGIYSGELKRKRQYKIEDRKLVGVFDNSLNIDDEVLQEVLSNESSDKMKNVVNTIQQEQNKVIRNIDDEISPNNKLREFEKLDLIINNMITLYGYTKDVYLSILIFAFILNLCTICLFNSVISE